MRIELDATRKLATLIVFGSRYKEALGGWQYHEPNQWKRSMGIGRRDVNAMIDNTLSNMHLDWDIYEGQRRSEFSARL